MADPNFELTFTEDIINSEQPEHQLLPICSPTLDDFQNSLSQQNSKDSNGSMNMDEFLKWLAQDNNNNNEAQGTTTAATIPVQQLNLQENNVSTQPTFGNMSLEEPNYAQLALPQQLQAPQQLPSLQYIPPQPQPQPVSSNGMGITIGRKRNNVGPSEDMEKRQKRIIKNRETAARSRAKKQAYVAELEEKLIQLTKENTQLKQLPYCEEEEATAKATKPPKAYGKPTELRRAFSSPY